MANDPTDKTTPPPTEQLVENPEPEVLKLSPRDSLAFAEALLNPREPNARLRETVRRYREMMGV